MVGMIVAEEHEVDRRQVVEGHARRPHPLRPDEGEGRYPFRPDRVGKDVEAARLHQHRRMADPGDAHRPARHPAGRHRRCHRDPLRPFGSRAHPAAEKEVEPPPLMRLHRRRRAAEVEEALTVIMAARRPVIIDPVEEGRHQGRREADRDAEEQQHDAKAPHPDTHRLSLAARVPVGSHTEPLPLRSALAGERNDEDAHHSPHRLPVRLIDAGRLRDPGPGRRWRGAGGRGAAGGNRAGANTTAAPGNNEMTPRPLMQNRIACPWPLACRLAAIRNRYRSGARWQAKGTMKMRTTLLTAFLCGSLTLAGCATLGLGGGGGGLAGETLRMETARGQTTHLLFQGDGTVRAAFGESVVTGRWEAVNRNLCFYWTRAPRARWPSPAPFRPAAPRQHARPPRWQRDGPHV